MFEALDITAETEASTDGAPGAESANALALPANLADLCDGRDKAIELWLQAYDGYHASLALAGAASIAGRLGLQAPSTERYGGDAVDRTRAFMTDQPNETRDRLTGKVTSVDAREHFAAIITKDVDRRCWDHMMVKLGLDQLLDRQAREEFQASLKTDPPAFTVENCRATFGTIWAGRRDMYLRGIANVFMAMDRRFRSHDAFAIGNRLIIERAMNSESWGGWNNYNRRDTLHDVERIFRELDGLGPIGLNQAGGIVHQVEQAKRAGGLPKLVQGYYFRVRVFQNGNLHLWFERKDLLKQVNALLLEYYKPVEGDTGDGPSYETGPAYHATPAKHHGQFFTSSDVAETVVEMAGIAPGMTVLEPSAGGGALARAVRDRGGLVACVEIQTGLAHELAHVHGFADVHCADFLKVSPFALPQYDRIVMNPPFDRGRDCDHVRHAYQFLKPGGTLVAIMSARAEFGTDARHKALHALIGHPPGSWKFERSWRDLPERSFAHAGTNVNTVVLKLEKPRA